MDCQLDVYLVPYLLLLMLFAACLCGICHGWHVLVCCPKPNKIISTSTTVEYYPRYLSGDGGCWCAMAEAHRAGGVSVVCIDAEKMSVAVVSRGTLASIIKVHAHQHMHCSAGVVIWCSHLWLEVS